MKKILIKKKQNFIFVLFSFIFLIAISMFCFNAFNNVNASTTTVPTGEVALKPYNGDKMYYNQTAKISITYDNNCNSNIHNSSVLATFSVKGGSFKAPSGSGNDIFVLSFYRVLYKANLQSDWSVQTDFQNLVVVAVHDYVSGGNKYLSSGNKLPTGSGQYKDVTMSGVAEWSDIFSGTNLADTKVNSFKTTQGSGAEKIATLSFSNEGMYRLEIRSVGVRVGVENVSCYFKAGDPNIAVSHEFIIDNTAPTGQATYVDNNGAIENGANVDRDFKFTYALNDEWKTDALKTIRYTHNSVEKSYTSGNSVTEEGAHVFEITDFIGHTTSYRYLLDKTSPTGNAFYVDSGEVVQNNVETNRNIRFKYEGTNANTGIVRTLDYYFNGTKTNYVNGNTISTEGLHVFTLSDSYGRSSSYSYRIDKTPPTIKVSPWQDETNGQGIYKTAFLEINQDMVGAKINSITIYYTSIKFSSTGFEKTSSEKIIINSSEFLSGYSETFELTGYYYVKLLDNAGNINETEFLVINNVGREYYNLNYLRKQGYLKTDNYKVNLPNYLATEVEIPDIGKDGLTSVYPGNYAISNKTYVFENYDNAIEFVVEMELVRNVTQTSSGWYYAGKNNAEYKSVESLREAIRLYAKDYVTEYPLPAWNTSPYIDSNTIVLDEGAYDNQSKKALQGLGIPLILDKYVFKNYSISYVGKYTTFTYNCLSNLQIMDDSSSLYNGPLNNKSFKDLIGNNDEYQYKIIETDCCGNETTYHVHYDYKAPQVQVEYEYYDYYEKDNDFFGETKTTQESLTGNPTRPNLKNLKITSIVDELDKITLVRIEYPDLSVLTTTDLSNLQFGFGENYLGGQYVIKVYDRSLNVFSFAFNIAKNPPQATALVNGMGDNKTLNISLSPTNDVVRFAIYRYDTKLPENGLYEEKAGDEILKIITISQSIYNYEFSLGGQYRVKILDTFGRVTTSDTFVFRKGLPTYTMKGAEENGKTRKEVTITYPITIGCKLKLDNQEKVAENYLSTTYEGATRLNQLTFSATSENNGLWYLKFYVLTDEMNYVETSFILDTTPPTAKLIDEQGGEVFWDSCVSKKIFVIAQDSDVRRIRYQDYEGYYKLYDISKGLYETASYTIVVEDDVGNTNEYKVQIDMVLDYKLIIQGNNYSIDETIYCANGFRVENLENMTISVVKDNENYTSKFYYDYVIDGSYVVNLKDYNQNTKTIKVICDKEPPEIEILRDEEDLTKPVTIKLNSQDIKDFAVKHNNKNLSIQLSDRFTLESWGTYSITIADFLSNKHTTTFDIAKIPPELKIYDTDGTELQKGITTNKSVYFSWNDNGATAKLTNESSFSKQYTNNSIINDEGTYTLTLKDEWGNEVVSSITITKIIDFNILDEFGLKLESIVVDAREKTANKFSVNVQDGINIDVTLKGENFEYSSGQIISTDGEYRFRLYDELGNEEIRTIILDRVGPIFEIAKRPNNTDAVTIYLKDAVNLSIEFQGATTKKELLAVQESYTFTEWGDYLLKASDELGNLSDITFKIEKIPPTITFQTTSGKELKDGDCVNEPIILVYDEDVTIKYNVDNSYNITYRQNQILTTQGKYIFTIIDLAMNEQTFELMLDNELLFSLVVDGTTIKDYSNIIGRRYFELTLKENLIVKHSLGVSKENVLIDSIVNLTDEGIHKLSLSDSVGNFIEFNIVLDRTAPTMTIDTENTTKSDVVLTCLDINDIDIYRILKDGDVYKNYILQNVNTFSEVGEYSITAYDNLRNKSVIEFKIKRGIRCELSIPNKFVSMDAVNLKLKESGLNVTSILNGQAVEVTIEDNILTYNQTGVWSIKITDELGNEETFTFTIDDKKFKDNFTFNIPRDSQLKITFNGSEFEYQEFIDGDILTLTKDGEYVLVLTHNGVTSSYAFKIDNELPLLILNGKTIQVGDKIKRQKKDFKIDATKEDCTITLYYNGKKVKYEVGDKLNAKGKYRVVIEDEAGHITEFELKKDFSFNKGLILLCVVSGTLVLTLIILVVRRRIKMKIE